MSNIYISEPHTHGKVILTTTCGEIEIELWPKEAPVACRNFVQLCLEGYYDHTIFHRVVKKFIIQGGDPTGTGDGGDSIYGDPFKMEIHSRLRFNRRGLVAMSCSNNKVDGSQFFFTLKEAPELQGNHTIFGSVVGKTIYNMINLGEGLIDKETERPLYPKEIISSLVVSNPFDDIVPRAKIISEEPSEPKSQMAAVKNYGLLSFGDEIEDDEESEFEFKGKGKSAHDHAKYSNLSSDVVQIDPNEEQAFVGKMDLAPVIIEKETKKKECKETIKKLREESRLILDELVSDFIKDRAAETNEKELPDDNLKTLISNKQSMSNSLLILSKFSEKIKTVTTTDWFYKPLTGDKNDEIEKAVFDPDVYNPEKYDLFDPRNPLNQRKRQADEPKFGGRTKNKKNE